MVYIYRNISIFLILVSIASFAYATGETTPCHAPLKFKITAGFPQGACFCPNGKKRSYKMASGTAELSPCTETVAIEVAKPAFCSADVDAQDMVDNSKAIKLVGNSSGDHSGSEVASAGDVNGDGYDDVLVGARYDYTSGSGSSYLIFGKNSGWASEIVLDTSSMNSGVGVRFYGDVGSDLLGESLAKTPGDFNGDGYYDILMGANEHDGTGNNRGAAYLFWGKSGSFTSPMETNDSNFIGDGDVAVKFEGNSNGDRAAYSLSSAGDFNGDGIDDLMIGVPKDDVLGDVNNGAVYITFGKTSGWSDAKITLAHTDPYFNGVNGLRIAGNSDDYWWAGSSIDTAGDFNGDGYDDIVIGAKFSDTPADLIDAGAAYVVFGSPGPWTAFPENSLDLDDLDGTNGFTIDGESAWDEMGESVAHIGDINADGYDDIAIGVPYLSDTYTGQGRVYVLFGKATWGSKFDVSTIDGTNGFMINGTAANDYAGSGISAAGDVNNDGIDDVLVGIPKYDTDIGTSKGAGFVIFGKNTAWDATIDVTTLDGGDGFRIEGHGVGLADDDSIGRRVNYLGDIDGDGYSDIIMGGIWSAPEPYGSDQDEAGTSYILFTDKICN